MTQSQTQLLRGFGPTEGSPPVAPTLAVEVADGVLIATVGGDAVVQHTLYGTTGTTGSAWVALGSRFGNGQITVEDLSPGVYRLIAISTLAGVNSTPGNLVTSTILDNPTQGDDYVSDTGITVTVDNDNLVVNITGKPGASHRVLYKPSTENVWKEGGVRSGDGQVTITSLPAATYHVQVKSV